MVDSVRSTRLQIGILNKLYEAIGKGYSVINGMHKAQAQSALEVSRKNFWINGAFQVSQRGDYTTATASAHDTYYLDRHVMREGIVSAELEHTTVTLPNGVTTNALKVSCASTPGGTGYMGFRQIIEDFQALSEQTITLSCWVRTNHPDVRFRHDSTADIGNSITPDGEWHHHVVTYKCPTISSAGTAVNQTAFAFFTYDGAAVDISVGDYFEVTHFKLEIGDTATPFEVEPYAEVLRKCQRYYQRWGDNASGDNYPVISNCHLETATEARGAIVFQTRMRTAPTMSASGSFRVYTTTALSVSGLGFQAATTTCAPISATCSSGTAGHGGILQANNDAAAYIAADAEIL